MKKIDINNLPVGGMDGVLERFMKEFFPFNNFKKIGFFTKEMKGDYQAQAERVCHFFGYETVYEYGAKSGRCHISYSEDEPDRPFVTVMTSIYD